MEPGQESIPQKKIQLKIYIISLAYLILGYFKDKLLLNPFKELSNFTITPISLQFLITVVKLGVGGGLFCFVLFCFFTTNPERWRAAPPCHFSNLGVQESQFQ